MKPRILHTFIKRRFFFVPPTKLQKLNREKQKKVFIIIYFGFFFLNIINFSVYCTIIFYARIKK